MRRPRALFPLTVLLMLYVATAVLGGPAPDAPPPAGPSVAGVVFTDAGTPIPQVTVRIPSIGRTATTGEDGRFTIPNVPPGTYRVLFSRIGYRRAERNLVVPAGGAMLDATLEEAPVRVPPIQVTAASNPAGLLAVAQPMDVLTDADAHLADAPTMGAAVESAPGVRDMGDGSGVGKPVIRGLRSDRVVIAADGQRTENQQWEDDEGPTLALDDVERVEVIRGPASVLYGSDALGGIINVVSRPLPTARDRSPFIDGWIHGSFGQNDRAGEERFTLEGARGGLGYRGAFQYLDQGDVRTPAGVQSNSAMRTSDAKGSLAWQGEGGSVTGSYAYLNSLNEVHPDPSADPSGTPFKRDDDQLARVAAVRDLDGARLDVTMGYERNERREYSYRDAPIDSVDNGKLDQRLSGDVRLQQASTGATHGIVGFAASHDRFTRFGSENQAPGSRQTDAGGYVFEQAVTGRWRWLAGARYDHRTLAIDADSGLGVRRQTRTYRDVTGTVGTLVRLGGPVALAGNVGRAFRAPSITELYTQGVDEGTQTVLRGNPGLRVERSLEADLGLRVHTEHGRADLEAFRNDVRDFIYARRTGALDPATRLPVVAYVQGDARLEGVELSAERDAGSHWRLRGGADYLRGDNTSTHVPLPWIPPLRVTGEVRYDRERLASLRGPYLEVGVEADAAQTRLDPTDVRTPGYGILTMEAGFELPVAGRRPTLDLQVTNLLDRRYVSFLDIHKTYAIEQGRNWILRLSTPI